MGWSSANGIFDPIAQALIDHGASDELKLLVCDKLIGVLQDGDWDTEGESLDEFKDDPAIVEAFRRHDVLVLCGYDDDSEFCELERGHLGDHADEDGNTWPSKVGAQP